jgi:hypothetical protein
MRLPDLPPSHPVLFFLMDGVLSRVKGNEAGKPDNACNSLHPHGARLNAMFALNEGIDVAHCPKRFDTSELSVTESWIILARKQNYHPTFTFCFI